MANQPLAFPPANALMTCGRKDEADLGLAAGVICVYLRSSAAIQLSASSPARTPVPRNRSRSLDINLHAFSALQSATTTAADALRKRRRLAGSWE